MAEGLEGVCQIVAGTGFDIAWVAPTPSLLMVAVPQP
jgi:hypothetical protein